MSNWCGLAVGYLYDQAAAVVVLKLQAIAKLIAAIRVRGGRRDLRAQRTGDSLGVVPHMVPNGAERDIDRCHSLLPVDQFERAVGTRTNDYASNKVFGGVAGRHRSQFVEDVAQ